MTPGAFLIVFGAMLVATALVELVRGCADESDLHRRMGKMPLPRLLLLNAMACTGTVLLAIGAALP